MMILRDKWNHYTVQQTNSEALLISAQHAISCLLHANVCLPNVEQIHTDRGGLRLCGTPGWNLERGPFYIYKTVVNWEKWMNKLKYLQYWHEKSLSIKNESLTNMDVTNSLISSLQLLLQTWNHIDKCLQTVAYLGYGRHGTCHGRHFDGGSKVAWQKFKYFFTVSWTSILRPMHS